MVLLAHSATAPLLPPLFADRPLGLSPADLSLLPNARKAKTRQHKECQTDTSELADLRVMQAQLLQVKDALGSVNSELAHAERRVRHEVREEMEERIHKFERGTKEKMNFLKKRQQTSISQMRTALQAQLESARLQQMSQLRKEHDQVHAVEEGELSAMRAELQRQQLLAEGSMRENRDLGEKVEKLQEALRNNSPPVSKRGSIGGEQDSEAKVAQLEAQLASRDATIKALRDQLAALQPSPLPPAPEAALPKAKGGGSKKNK